MHLPQLRKATAGATSDDGEGLLEDDLHPLLFFSLLQLDGPAVLLNAQVPFVQAKGVPNGRGIRSHSRLRLDLLQALKCVRIKVQLKAYSLSFLVCHTHLL